MNPIDDQLSRLFRSAAQARPLAMTEPPFGLETRVLAAWQAAPEFNFWEPKLLVRGLLLAALIMVVSLWPVVDKTVDPNSEYLQLADSTTQMDTTP